MVQMVDACWCSCFWREKLSQDLQELGLLKETILQKALMTPKLSSICHQLRETTTWQHTYHVISCHKSCHIHLYVLRWRIIFKSELLHTTFCRKIHTTLRHDLYREMVQWSGRTEAGQRTLECTRTASTGAAWRSFSDLNISPTFPDLEKTLKWLRWNYSKVKQWTSKSQFQSKLFDPFSSLFVPFRLFFGVKQSWVMAAWVVRMWQGFTSAWRTTGLLSAESLRPGSQEPSVACSCQCSKACSSQRWQGKVEKIDQLERDIQTARDFSGNWSMHQETRGPYVKSFCIMQRAKILILHWSWFCVRPFIILVNCRSLLRFDFEPV